MPKVHAKIDESELIELVKENPEIYDGTDDQDRIEEIWEDIADQMQTKVGDIKKAWNKVSSMATKRRSLRSDSLSFLHLPITEHSNENSRASSARSSPRKGMKRITRSMSKISTASESERQKSPRSDISDVPTSTRKKGKRTPMKNTTKSKNKSLSDDEPSKTNPTKKQNRKDAALAAKEAQDKISFVPKRLSDFSLSKNNLKNMVDPTRAFFESMGMTVSTFPQRLQAQIKQKICNIVTEAELDLSIPPAC